MINFVKNIIPSWCFDKEKVNVFGDGKNTYRLCSLLLELGLKVELLTWEVLGIKKEQIYETIICLEEFETEINKFFFHIENVVFLSADILLGMNWTKYIDCIPPIYKTLFDNGVETVEHLIDLSFVPERYIIDNIYELKDCSTPCVKIKNGIRNTVNQENCIFNNKIFFFGSSNTYGTLLSDEQTICSYMQKYLNECRLENNYLVVNCGVYGETFIDTCNRILKENIKKGDIVILFNSFFYWCKELDKYDNNNVFCQYCENVEEYCKQKGAYFVLLRDFNLADIKKSTKFQNMLNEGYGFYIKAEKVEGIEFKFIDWKKVLSRLSLKNIIYLDLLDEFEKYNIKYELFRNWNHFSQIGNKVFAKIMVKMLYNFFPNDYSGKQISIDLPYDFYCGLQKYIKKIGIYRDNDYKNNGAIVMNANPFTLGHLYLVEEALKCVDILYVFVVSEQKSFFDFEDRYEMVKRGCVKYENVVVLPSEKYLISQETFNEYFSKKNFNNDNVYTDIYIFAHYIAPVLNIKKRFVGTEPLCIITDQYNDLLRQELLNYDIELIEIKRKMFKGSAISATRVREYILNRDYENMRHYLPSSSFEYIYKIKILGE